MSITKDRIKCPECGTVQDATIEFDRSWMPFPCYVHDCEKCGYTIMESEWERDKSSPLLGEQPTSIVATTGEGK